MFRARVSLFCKHFCTIRSLEKTQYIIQYKYQDMKVSRPNLKAKVSKNVKKEYILHAIVGKPMMVQAGSKSEWIEKY